MARSRPHKCTECTKTFPSPADLKRHVASVHRDERPHACDECERAFKDASTLRKHVARVHSEERPHVCDECERAFRDTSDLRRHIASVHRDERPHVCDVCQRAFKDMNNLREHRRVHEQVKPFECDECHRFFFRSHNLRKHMLTKHAAGVETTQHDDADDRPYVCPICGLGFKDSSNFSRHKRTHVPARKFKCPECHKFMSRKSDYPRHQRTCIGARSADTVSADEEPSLGDDVGSAENDESDAFAEPVPEETEVDNDFAFAEDVDMLDDNEAAASGESDTSIELSASAPPMDEEGTPIDAEPRDGPAEQGLTTNDEAMGETAAEGSFHARLHDVNPSRYRSRSDSSDDDGDDAGTQSDGEEYFIQLNPAPTEDDALTANRVPSLLYIETFRLEQASPKSARLAVQCVTGSGRPKRLPLSYSSMPSALADLTTNRWLHRCFVQKLDFLLHPTEDARHAIGDQQWRLFGESLETTHIAEWNVQGVHLSAVGRFADIGAPFRLAASIGSVRVRHCPRLRPNDYASISKACSRGNVRSLQLQPLAARDSPYELTVEQMVDALSGSALTNVLLISAKMPTRFLEGLLRISAERRRLPSITIRNSNTARAYFNHLSKRFTEYMHAETGEFRIPLTALGSAGTDQYVTFRTDGIPAKTITFSPAYEARY